MRKFLIAALFFLFFSCKKNADSNNNNNSSTSLTSGRAGIIFKTNEKFGGSKAFNVKNTSLTKATTQAFGSSIRYVVIKAEEKYGGLADTRMATLHITVPVPATLPVAIDMATAMSAVPSAQLELYESSIGGVFGSTYWSQSGQLKITKLTNTEIEGVFSAVTIGSLSSGYTVSNGSFAGKF